MKLIKSLAIISSGILTKFLPFDPNKLFERLKFLLQEKQTGKYSNVNNYETVAIVDKLLEYKCISNKQHKQTSIKSNLLHTKKKIV